MTEDDAQMIIDMQERAVRRLRQAYADLKRSFFQGTDSEQAMALMTMDLLLGVNAEGDVVDSPSLFDPGDD